jgi:hypothetical protein
MQPVPEAICSPVLFTKTTQLKHSILHAAGKDKVAVIAPLLKLHTSKRVVFPLGCQDKLPREEETETPLRGSDAQLTLPSAHT